MVLENKEFLYLFDVPDGAEHLLPKGMFLVCPEGYRFSMEIAKIILQV